MDRVLTWLWEASDFAKAIGFGEPDDYISVENISHNITVFCSIYTKYEFDPGFHVLPFLSGFFIFLEYSMKRVGVFDSDKSSWQGIGHTLNTGTAPSNGKVYHSTDSSTVLPHCIISVCYNDLVRFLWGTNTLKTCAVQPSSAAVITFCIGVTPVRVLSCQGCPALNFFASPCSNLCDFLL